MFERTTIEDRGAPCRPVFTRRAVRAAPRSRALRGPAILVAIVASLVLVAGCASAGGTSAAGGDPDVISSEQLRSSEFRDQDAYQVVQRLRPNWLRARGSSIAGDRPLPVVYLNGSRYGPADSLRDFPVSSVEHIEYIDSREATTRFGTGHTAGAILVRTF